MKSTFSTFSKGALVEELAVDKMMENIEKSQKALSPEQVCFIYRGNVFVVKLRKINGCEVASIMDGGKIITLMIGDDISQFMQPIHFNVAEEVNNESVQIKDREKEGYTDKKPDKDGLYLLVCEENNNKAEWIAVSGGATIMHSKMGKENLDSVHDNLIWPMWKFIG